MSNQFTRPEGTGGKSILGSDNKTPPNDLEKNAKKKLIEKNCDWLIANDVSNKSIGFDSDFNEVSIFYKNENIKNEKISIKKKSEISDKIVEKIINHIS